MPPFSAINLICNDVGTPRMLYPFSLINFASDFTSAVAARPLPKPIT